MFKLYFITKQSPLTFRTSGMGIEMTSEQYAELNAKKRRPIRQLLPQCTEEEIIFLETGTTQREQDSALAYVSGLMSFSLTRKDLN